MNMPARWWRREEAPVTGNAARCGLCHHACLLEKDQSGYCGARFFDGETVVSPYLGQFSSIAVDPVEKKPLNHWRSGSFIFSLGSVGCTMRCPFCQNHCIAQPKLGHSRCHLELTPVSPEALVGKMRELRLDAVAFTYNEPALQAEYIIETAPVLREAGIAVALISNGMYSEALLHELAPFVDAANIDLKCFQERTYARLGGSLEVAKRSIEGLLAAGVHVEVTTLVAPGVSDEPEEFAAEIDYLASLSPDIPLHISRYRPAHKFSAPPTDIALLQRFAALAKTRLAHVHIGNVPQLHGGS